MAATAAGLLGNGSGDLVGIDAPIGQGVSEVLRLAVGQCGMLATFLAFGEALVDPIPIRLIFDDENTAVRHGS
jgi:hypothetical protein